MIYLAEKSVIRTISCLFMLALISGCASLSQSECISANWFDLGANDANQGRQSSYVAEHTKACSDYAIRPDLLEYKRGWEQAITAFCSSESGWRYGRQGGYYRQSCPQALEQSFLYGYHLGKQIQGKEAEIREVKQDRRRLFHYSLADNAIDKHSADLSSERLSLWMDLNMLELELFRLNNKARALGFTP